MADRGMENDKKHTLTLGQRAHAEITGVTEVESFDEQTVVLRTDCGELTVEGEALHIGTLDIARGVVMVDGRVDGVYYSDATPRRGGLRGRLFG